MTEETQPSPTRRQAVLLLAAVLALFSWNAWGHDLWAPDEPYFAEGAREMIDDGRWVVPHVNGAITTDKPPLFFWLIAFFSWPAGVVTSLTARLPSLLAGLGTALLIYRLGVQAGDRRSAAWAVVVFATAALVWRQARSAQIDMVLCFLETAAIVAFVAFRRGTWSGRRAGLVFWALCALAVLAKGPVGFIVPLGVALVTLAWDRSLSSWRRFAPFTGPALFLVMVFSWLVAAALWNDGAYSPLAAFREHVLDRATQGMHHPQPPWYYAEVLPVQLLPWTGLLPAALVAAWRRRRDSTDRLLLAWAAFVVLFFSIPVEKRDLYVLPAFPALALLVARLATSSWRPRESDDPLVVVGRSRWAWTPQALVGAAFLAAGLALPFLVERSYPEYATYGLLLAVVLAVGGAATCFTSLTRRTRLATMATAGTAVALYVTAATFVLPALDPIKSARRLAVETARLTEADRADGGRVHVFRLDNLPDALSFYSRGMYVVEQWDAEAAAAALQAPRDHLLLPASALDEVTDLLPEPPRVMLSVPLARRTVLLLGLPRGTPADGVNAASEPRETGDASLGTDR